MSRTKTKGTRHYTLALTCCFLSGGGEDLNLRPSGYEPDLPWRWREISSLESAAIDGLTKNSLALSAKMPKWSPEGSTNQFKGCATAKS